MHELPKIQEEGYSMLIDNSDMNNIKVKVQASNMLRPKPFYIIGTVNNEKLYQGKFTFNAQSVFDFEIPKSKLPSGVITLTLFDEHMRPWSERPIFINNNEELIIQAELDNYNFDKRNKFELKVNIKDIYGTPLSTNFSIAITDADVIDKNKFGTNILTHLLLESDVKGYIESPGYFFSDIKRSTRAKLDLVMLTHGWRKYNWQEMPNMNFSLPKKFPFKKGYDIYGIATNKQDEPLKNRDLKMIAKSEGELLDLYTTKTNDDGSFVINNVTNSGKVELAFNAYQSDEDQIETKVILTNSEEKSDLPKSSFSKSIKNIIEELSETDSKKATPFFVYDDAEVLDEVLVNANVETTNELTKYSRSLYGVKPDHTIINEDKTAGNILYHLGNVPGVNVDLSNESVFFRGNAFGPLWIIDGMRLENEGDPRDGGAQDRSEIAASGTTDLYADKSLRGNIPSMMHYFDFSNVERIEILKFGSETAIYGPSGRYGVIIVYTKTGKAKPNNSFSSKHTIQGYSELKEFYSPKYDVVKESHKNVDNRTTIYWNPSVKTDKNGNATIEFYNTDSTKSFEVDIQSISKYGTPGAYLNTVKEK
jgi:hypothetical protein